jgi:hypothetical protein
LSTPISFFLFVPPPESEGCMQAMSARHADALFEHDILLCHGILRYNAIIPRGTDGCCPTIVRYFHAFFRALPPRLLFPLRCFSPLYRDTCLKFSSLLKPRLSY